MRRLLWASAALIAVVTAAAVLGRPADVRLSDLSVYLGATADLDAGLYDFFRGKAPFTYPPFAALLLHPLTWLPVTVVQLTWTAATIATVIGIARMTGRARGWTAAALAPVLMLSAPVSSDLKYGQVSLFLAAMILADVLLLRRTRGFGALIGLAAAVKLTPLIVVPLLWCAGRRRAAVTAVATFAGCALAGVLVLPAESWRFWTEAMFQVSRLGYIHNVGNQSLNGALIRFGLEPGVRMVLVLVIGGAVAALGLWRATRLARDGDWLAAVIVIGAASVVLSPVSWTHHQIWLVLAVLLPVRVHQGWWTAVVLAFMLLPVTAVWGNARLVLAITIAAAVPLVSPRRPAAAPASPPAPVPTAGPMSAGTARPRR